MTLIPAYSESTYYRETYSYDNETAEEESERVFNGYLIQARYSSFYDRKHSVVRSEASADADDSTVIFRLSRSDDGIEEVILHPAEAAVALGDVSLGTITTCLYCGEKLQFSNDRAVCFDLTNNEATGFLNEHGTDDYSLLESFGVCPQCGWWTHTSRVEKSSVYYHDFHSGRRKERGYITTSTFGKLKTYSVSASDIPIDALRRHLAKKYSDLSMINATRFESLMAACFREKFGTCEVLHVGGVGDSGIDIKLVRGDTIEALVQVKRRTNLNATESVQTVRELNGVLLRDGVARGIVVTTAAKFSAAAQREAESKPRSLARYKVDLIALPDVLNLLKCATDRASIPSDSEMDAFAHSKWRSEALELHKLRRGGHPFTQ